VATARQMIELAASGATLVFERQLPGDVPGFREVEQRRAELGQLLARIQFPPLAAPPSEGLDPRPEPPFRRGTVGQGQVLVGDVLAGLGAAGIGREPMFDHPGLLCVRRRVPGSVYYFVANRSDTNAFSGWVPLGRAGKRVVLMDPLTGRLGTGTLRQTQTGMPEVRLALVPGESVILRCLEESGREEPRWESWKPAGSFVELQGSWKITFVEGGPELPPAFQSSRLASWTELGNTNAQRFAGTARYALRFDTPVTHTGSWELHLGRVCQSARVRVNGKELGTLFVAPFRVVVGALQAKDNLLEVEVTNPAANRIRDLDRRGVPWKSFHDINFVNLDYKPFNAADWPLVESGLIGPVRLRPVVAEGAEDGPSRQD